MMTQDEAIAIGCRKYRELYPKGMIPAELEEQGVLGAIPGQPDMTVHVTFWFKGERDPFFLFRAIINRESGDVTVLDAADWRILKDKEFNDSKMVT